MKLFGHRHSIRLKKYDYSNQGLYFVTICTQNRKYLFWNFVVGATRGSPFNKIVNYTWKSLPDHHPVILDEFVIMPNHIHFIIYIMDKGGSRPAPTLGTIIGLFKSECTKKIRQLINNSQFIIWQRNYHEHIIRKEFELNRIRQYIRDNPKNWDEDENNLKSKGGEI